MEDIHFSLMVGKGARNVAEQAGLIVSPNILLTSKKCTQIM